MAQGAAKGGDGDRSDSEQGQASIPDGRNSVVGGIGAVAAAVPFVMSLLPSERAKAAGAPIEVDISKIEPGQKIDVEWRGKVCWLINRTAGWSHRCRSSTTARRPEIRRPAAAPLLQERDRSIKPSLLIAVGICTHLGCSPTFRPELAPADLGPIGSAASSARATSRSSISRAASTRACRRRRTWSFRRTGICPTRASSSAKTQSRVTESIHGT